MRPGLALGIAMVAMAFPAASPAQNLGLGTGSRPPIAQDSTEPAAGNPAAGMHRENDEASPRKKQLTRRLGLTARKTKEFDPKIYEARGKELQGQFYEIGTPADNPGRLSGGGPKGGGAQQTLIAGPSRPSRHWMIWVGLAGAAGASAGALGYFMMSQSHPPSVPPPNVLDLSDDPAQP